jgi:hypothetical protein
MCIVHRSIDREDLKLSATAYSYRTSGNTTHGSRRPLILVRAILCPKGERVQQLDATFFTCRTVNDQ